MQYFSFHHVPITFLVNKGSRNETFVLFSYMWPPTCEIEPQTFDIESSVLPTCGHMLQYPSVTVVVVAVVFGENDSMIIKHQLH